MLAVAVLLPLHDAIAYERSLKLPSSRARALQAGLPPQHPPPPPAPLPRGACGTGGTAYGMDLNVATNPAVSMEWTNAFGIGYAGQSMIPAQAKDTGKGALPRGNVRARERAHLPRPSLGGVQALRLRGRPCTPVDAYLRGRADLQ